MELQSLFPNWRAASTNPNVDWGLDVDITDDAAYFSLLVAIVEDQAASSKERPGEFASICNAIVLDLIELQKSQHADCKAINLEYLQFETALAPLRLALNVGDFGLTHDWIINGCSENLSQAAERQFHASRLAEFTASHIPWIAINRGSTITDWSTAFYYYCRARAALFDQAVVVFPVAVQATNELPPGDERAVNCLCMIFNWTIAYGLASAPELALALRKSFDAPGASLSSKVRIAVLFAAVAAGYTDREPSDWAAWALKHGGSSLGSHEPFQLLWAQINSIEEWDSRRVEVFATAAYYAFSLHHFDSPTATIRATDQRSALLNPAVVRLAQFERDTDLLTIFAEWYGIPRGKRLTSRVLFVLPGYENGIVYLGGRRQYLPSGDEHRLADLIGVTNEALGIILTVRGERAAPALPTRGGEPAYELGPRFADALANMYRFDALDAEMLADRRAMISFPGYPHPLQALMAASRSRAVLPISSSLQEPEADRPIRRALLWAADNDLYSSFEIDAVQAVLTRAGVDCQRRSGINSRAGYFSADYANADYDLIWFAGHGEIDHWRDGSAQLLDGNGSRIGIDELIARMPQASGRRLLMLNICDGGVSAVNGGIHRLGLAPMLANAAQATISHLWPVRPPAAAAFGVLFADALTHCHGHFAAFAHALPRMHAPSTVVTGAVRQIAPEEALVQRLETLHKGHRTTLQILSPKV